MLSSRIWDESIQRYFVVPPNFSGEAPPLRLLLREGDRARLRARWWNRLPSSLPFSALSQRRRSLSGGAAGYSCSVFAVLLHSILYYFGRKVNHQSQAGRRVSMPLLVPAVFPDWEKPPTLLSPVSSSPPEVVSSAHTS